MTWPRRCREGRVVMRAKWHGKGDPALVRLTCASPVSHAHHMSPLIQIRHVPDALHRRLKALAALAGQSLSDYLTGELRRTAERPTLEELRQRIAARQPVRLNESPAEAIRAEREQHESVASRPRRRSAG